MTTNAPQDADRRLPDRLTLDRSALVVIDLQERFRDLIHGMDQVLERSQRLIGFCRQLEIPVLVTEQYPRGLGVTVSEIREACRPFTAFEKNSFSCAGGKGFLGHEVLDGLGLDQPGIAETGLHEESAPFNATLPDETGARVRDRLLVRGDDEARSGLALLLRRRWGG